MARTVLLKVGGSLLDWPEWPDRLRSCLAECFQGACATLVVGGGESADVIRRLDAQHGLGPVAAHALALRTLDVTAHLAATLLPGSVVVEDRAGVDSARERDLIAIFAPRRFLETVDARSASPLPAGWDTTTDSIAARVAESLGVDDLVLLKSAPAGPSRDRQAAARAGLVDLEFPLASAPFRRVGLINLRQFPPRPEWLD